jgi:ElaB/YqjD/DUF883 family membrane-anchored ribosome-binding protein
MATESPSATDNAKQQVQDKAQEVQEKARSGAQQAQSRLRDQVDQRSTQAGDQVSTTAEALRQTADRLREQGQEPHAKAAEKVAEHAERVGGYLTESDADRILHDAEDFGRRQPMAVIGLGLAVGFAASRFLKASSRKRYEGAGQADPSRYQAASNRYGVAGEQVPVVPGGSYES